MNTRKSLLAVLSAASLSVFTAACGSSSPEVIDVLFFGEGFNSHFSRTVYVFTEGEVNSGTVNTNGNFLVGTWVDLDRDADITVDYYVDVDGDSACTVADPAWTTDLVATATTDNQAVILPLVSNSSFSTTACGSF